MTSHVAPRLSLGSVAAGVVFCFSVSLLSAGALTLVLMVTPMTERALPAIINVLGALSVFAGGFASARRSGALGWLHGGLSGVTYVVLCFLVGLVAFPGLLPAAALLRRLVLGFGIGLVGGIAAVNF